MKKLLLVGLILLPIQRESGSEPAPQELIHINQALREWLQLMDADRLYLVVDRQAGELRLQHGRAVLRNCPVVRYSWNGHLRGHADLEGRIRRYRPSDPWSDAQAGPFNWEQNLVEEATKDCALLFTNGLLIYASEVWERPRSPALKLQPEDLQALYNVAAAGLPMLILPQGWDGEP
jgi:hypothetical protein